MRYFPGRARKKLDISLLLKVCPECLGDLVFRSDFSGDYYRCLQCNQRMEPRNRIGRLPSLPRPMGTDASEFFPAPERVRPATG
jgi:hypothetical protein